MSTEIDFKQLWNNAQKKQIPDASEIFKKGEQLQRTTRNKLIFGNLIPLAFTIVFISWVWIHYQPEMLTTKIGLVLVIGAIAMFIVTSMGYINLLYKNETDSSSHEYLHHLLRIKQKQDVLGTTMMSIYFILLSVGIGLYMIEYAGRGSLTFKLCAYGLTYGWIAFNWFYTRPRAIKKQRDKINVVIVKLEELNRQLESSN